MASERASELAEDFAAANGEVVAFARSCSDASSGGGGARRGVDGRRRAPPHRRGSRARAALAERDGAGRGRDRHRGRASTGTTPRMPRRASDGAAAPRRSLSSRRTAPGSKRCCAASATRSWTGRRPSARPDGQELPTAALAPVAARPRPRAPGPRSWPHCGRPSRRTRRPSASVAVQGGRDLRRPGRAARGPGVSMRTVRPCR